MKKHIQQQTGLRKTTQKNRKPGILRLRKESLQISKKKRKKEKENFRKAPSKLEKIGSSYSLKKNQKKREFKKMRKTEDWTLGK